MAGGGGIPISTVGLHVGGCEGVTGVIGGWLLGFLGAGAGRAVGHANRSSPSCRNLASATAGGDTGTSPRLSRG